MTRKLTLLVAALIVPGALLFLGAAGLGYLLARSGRGRRALGWLLERAPWRHPRPAAPATAAYPSPPVEERRFPSKRTAVPPPPPAMEPARAS